MGRTYYEILGISPSATMSQIVQAINHLREVDKDGRFYATLARIENELTNPIRRNEYNRSIGVEINTNEPSRQEPIKEEELPQNFLDSSDINTETAQQRAKREIQEIKINLKNMTTPTFKAQAMKNSGISKRTVITIMVCSILALTALVISKPIYDEVKARHESDLATEALKKAQTVVEDYIRKNRVFPDKLPAGAPSGPWTYGVRDTKAGHEISLTFNAEAAKPLQGASLTLQSFIIPNRGLSWRCVPSNNIPEHLRPSGCY